MNEIATESTELSSGDQTSSVTAPKPARLQLSCTKCRARKVKCDRVQPCNSCCIQGHPSDCVFLVDRPEDHEPIKQSYEIRTLRAEVEKLKTMVLTQNIEQHTTLIRHSGENEPAAGASQTDLSWQSAIIGEVNRRHLALENIFASIRSASDQEAQSIVHQIRLNHNLEYIAASTNPVPLPSKIQEEEVDQDRIEMAEDQRPDIMEELEEHSASVVQANRSARRVPVRHKLGSMAQKAGRAFPRRHRSLEPSLPHSMRETPVKEVFLENFLDSDRKEPPVFRALNWLRGAVELSYSSPLLHNAFESASTLYFGLSINDSRIVLAAQKLYTKFLKTLQQALWSPGESRSSGTLFAVLMASHFEILQLTSETALLNHVVGATKLVEYRGPQSHVSGIEHLCFLTLRVYWIMTSIYSRSPTFLARHEWKTIPWSVNPSSKDLLQYVLDHFADIPTLLAEFDMLAEAESNFIAVSAEQDRQAMFCRLLHRLEHRLHQWRREHVDPRGQPFEISLQQNSATELRAFSTSYVLPTFQCQDMSSQEIITPTLISYPDPILACALYIYYSILLVISLYDIRTEGKIQLQEQYNLACFICRSAEYFTRIFSRDNLFLILFGLRVAYDTFLEGSLERQWVEDVYLLIGRTYKMKACETLGREFSVLKRERFGAPEVSDASRETRYNEADGLRVPE